MTLNMIINKKDPMDGKLLLIKEDNMLGLDLISLKNQSHFMPYNQSLLKNIKLTHFIWNTPKMDPTGLESKTDSLWKNIEEIVRIHNT